MAENRVKIVNIVESNVGQSSNNNGQQSQPIELEAESSMDSTVAALLAASKRGSQISHRPHTNDEIFMEESTFTDRIMRYLVILVYLCGVCSLGFFLSIYHIFFWDSRMPPVYKPAPTKKPLFAKY